MQAFRMSYKNNHPLFGVKSLLVVMVICTSRQCEQQDLCRAQKLQRWPQRRVSGQCWLLFDFSAADGDGLSHMAQWRKRQLCWGTQDVHNDNEGWVELVCLSAQFIWFYVRFFLCLCTSLFLIFVNSDYFSLLISRHLNTTFSGFNSCFKWKWCPGAQKI